MTSLTDIICATTEDERKTAQDALANRNAAAPTDYLGRRKTSSNQDWRRGRL